MVAIVPYGPHPCLYVGNAWPEKKHSLSSYTAALAPENEPLFSLAGCSNLSELTLDMEHTRSCLVTTTTNILSTLGPLQHTRLECIRLTTKCFYQWICGGTRDRPIPAWSNLDATLSKLAKVAIDIGERRLTFVLTFMCNGECIPFARKWLPELLHRFHGLGELHVEYGQGRPKTDGDRSCFCGHGPICPED